MASGERHTLSSACSHSAPSKQAALLLCCAAACQARHLPGDDVSSTVAATEADMELLLQVQQAAPATRACSALQPARS